MRTQRIKAYVMIAPDVTYNVEGYGGDPGKRMNFDLDEDGHWLTGGLPEDIDARDCDIVCVEADVPFPQVRTVEGTVSQVIEKEHA